MSTIIEDRAVSGFPISIGTSIALESFITQQQPAYDPERKIPDVPFPLKYYDSIYINLETLIRNFISALPGRDTLSKVSAPEIANAIIEESELIREVIEEDTGKGIEVIFYVNHLDVLYKDKKEIMHLRVPSTDNQKKLAKTNKEVVRLLISHVPGVKIFRGDIVAPAKPKSIILTHNVYDLLSYKYFTSLDLLESHTGLVKPRHLWNSKFYKTPGLNVGRLPFQLGILRIMGDTSLFKPAPVKYRRLLSALSIEAGWHALINEQRVVKDIQKSNSSDLQSLYFLKNS